MPARRAGRADEERVRHLPAARCTGSVAPVKLPASIGTFPGPTSLGSDSYGKRLGDRHRRLRVRLLAQVVPHREPLRGAEPLLQPGEELRARRLVAAARAEDGADERAERDDVVARERRDEAALRLEVRVDAAHVRVDVGDELTARLRLRRELHLRVEERLRLRARHELPPGERERERVVAGHVERGDARGPAEQLEVEAAVLGGRPAGAELRRGAALPVDVRDVVRVAVDRHALLRMLGAHRLRTAEAERLALVVPREVGRRDVPLVRRQAVVQVDLRRQVGEFVPSPGGRTFRASSGVVGRRGRRRGRAERERSGHEQRQGDERHPPHGREPIRSGRGVLAAFAAALVAFRLAGALARRWRSTRRPELLAWAWSLAAYAVAAAAIAWGEAAQWDARAFRVYYAAGALLTAPLLGFGSLALAGVRRAAPPRSSYGGFALGLAVAVPVHGAFARHGIPPAQDHLAFLPARLLAIARQRARDARGRRRRAPLVPAAAARQRAHPPRGRRGRGRQRPRRARRGRRGRRDRPGCGASLRGFRHRPRAFREGFLTPSLRNRHLRLPDRRIAAPSGASPCGGCARPASDSASDSRGFLLCGD